jgi:hypothetical protein
LVDKGEGSARQLKSREEFRSRAGWAMNPGNDSDFAGLRLFIDLA